jgi:hypothetical protein
LLLAVLLLQLLFIKYEAGTMEVRFRQKSIGWCSVYLLANIFRNSDFLSFTDNEKFKGCGEEEVNFMLEDMRTGVKTEKVAYSSQNYSPLPKDWVYNSILNHPEEEPSGIEICIIPYLLTVSLIPGILHHVGVLNYKGKLFYLDPYLEEMIQLTSLELFTKLFREVYVVERFILSDGSNIFAVLKGENLGYDFLIENEQHA